MSATANIKSNDRTINLNTATKKNKLKNNKGQGTAILHIMLIPALILLFIYSYLPMFGVVIAFQQFDIAKGVSAFWQSKWIGLDNYKIIIQDYAFIRAFLNTLFIAFLKMITMFIAPIILALLLNEVRKSILKRSIQTIVYLPHFLSWVILAGILKNFLSGDGMINTILTQITNGEPYYFLTDKKIFVGLLITSNIWKEVGFSAIVYLAAITNIDPNLYESAMIDGANRWKQTWHITLPGMRPIIVLCFILSLGGILNAGFDQIYNLYSAPVYEVADVIDTIVYRKSFQSGMYEIGTAVGLFNSVVGSICIITSYWCARKFANYEVF